MENLLENVPEPVTAAYLRDIPVSHAYCCDLLRQRAVTLTRPGKHRRQLWPFCGHRRSNVASRRGKRQEQMRVIAGQLGHTETYRSPPFRGRRNLKTSVSKSHEHQLHTIGLESRTRTVPNPSPYR